MQSHERRASHFSPVDDLVCVQIIESQQNLLRIDPYDLLWQREPPDDGGEGAARDPFQENVERPVDDLRAAVLHNVLVSEIFHDVDLLLQEADVLLDLRAFERGERKFVGISSEQGQGREEKEAR